MAFGSRLEAAQSHASGDHRIAACYEQFLKDQPEYSMRAKDFAYGELGSGRMEGPKALRASEGGECPRMRVMRRIGFKTDAPSIGLRNIFATGSFLHLKWQLAGLTGGWLTDCEVPFYAFDGLVRGKADAVTSWRAAVDFKTANAYSYKGFAAQPKRSHVFQVVAACSALGYDKGHLIYENKDTGSYTEHIIDVTPELIEEVRADAQVAGDALAAKQLPVIKDECVVGESATFKRCFMSSHCRTADLTAAFEGMWPE